MEAPVVRALEILDMTSYLTGGPTRPTGRTAKQVAEVEPETAFAADLEVEEPDDDDEEEGEDEEDEDDE